MLSRVLSRNDKLQKMCFERFGDEFRTVRDYCAVHADAVQIEDVSPWLPVLADGLIMESAADDLIE